ncbi:MAG: hypothetical protein Crog4KO_23040 [Crocinitomicaceae bacterium]
MSFLTTIRNSINGTTQFFQNGVKGKWGFFALFLLVFGIVQLLTLLIFLFIYAGFTGNTEYGITNVLGDMATGQLQFVLQFISLYMLLFMVVMLKRANGGRATELNFGDLFQRIPASTFIVYFVSVLFSLLLMLYFSSQVEDYFFGRMGDSLMQVPFYAEEKWYWVLIKNLSIFLLRYLPAIVLGYYVVSLKEGRWKWEFIKTKFTQVLAIIGIVIMLMGLYETVMELVSRSIISVLAQSLQNQTILIIFAIGLSFLFSVVYNGVVGCLAYFAVHTDVNENSEMDTRFKEGDTDILDQ